MGLPIRYLPEARQEYGDALLYYRRRSRRAALAFREELRKACDMLADHPFAGPEVEGSLRQLVLSRYPFMIIYEHVEDVVVILAIAHCSRLPGYWEDRLEG